MAITKEIVIGKIEVVGEYRGIQIREDVVIKEDNKEWVNDSHSHCKYVGICDGLNELINCLEVEFLGKAYKGNRGDKYE